MNIKRIIKNNHQNYICKRSFSDIVKKFTYEDKERFLEYYLNNVGIRKAAKFMKCSPSLLVRWLREFINNLQLDLDKAKDKLKDDIPDIIEMDEAQRQGDVCLHNITNEWL